MKKILFLAVMVSALHASLVWKMLNASEEQPYKRLRLEESSDSDNDDNLLFDVSVLQSEEPEQLQQPEEGLDFFAPFQEGPNEQQLPVEPAPYVPLVFPNFGGIEEEGELTDPDWSEEE